MSTMDFETCKNQKLIRDDTPDKAKVSSLLKDANNKFSTANSIELTKNSASSIITLHYDSIREQLAAIASKEGFKINNHECYKAFLHSILKKPKIAIQFDKARRIRNRINYYGSDLQKEKAQEVILLGEMKQSLLSLPLLSTALNSRDLRNLKLFITAKPLERRPISNQYNRKT